MQNESNMTKNDKLIERFKKLPTDFTFDEVVKLFATFGYSIHNKGNTSGSRIRFKKDGSCDFIDLHKPHPENIMKEWMMKTIYQHFKNKGLI